MACCMRGYLGIWSGNGWQKCSRGRMKMVNRGKMVIMTTITIIIIIIMMMKEKY